MLVSDLLHSCANDRVAAAAVSSIGGVFALRIQARADLEGLTIGSYVAQAVRAFASTAGERDWRDLIAALHGHDHPVLAGLQRILERQDALAGSTRQAMSAGVFAPALQAAAAAA